MKKYLEIYVGSRGVLEGVELREFDNIEEYLEEKRVRNVEGIEDEDDLGLFDWNKEGYGYVLGLGDEEEKMYVDVESKEFKEYFNSGFFSLVEKWVKEKYDGDWNKIDNNIIIGLVESFRNIGYE
jgi:hypothetical protein